MLLSIHQNASREVGNRGPLVRAGIRYVELSDRLLAGFLENDMSPVEEGLRSVREFGSTEGLLPVNH